MNDLTTTLATIKNLISNNESNELLRFLYSLKNQNQKEIKRLSRYINNLKSIHCMELCLREQEIFNANKIKFSPVTLWGGIFDKFKLIEDFRFSLEEFSIALTRMNNLSLTHADFDGFTENEASALLELDCFSKIKYLELTSITSNFQTRKNRPINPSQLNISGSFQDNKPIISSFTHNTLNTLNLFHSSFYSGTSNFFKDLKFRSILIKECYFKINPLEDVLNSLIEAEKVCIFHPRINQIDDSKEFVDFFEYALQKNITSFGISGDFVNGSFINELINNSSKNTLHNLSFRGSYQLTNNDTKLIKKLIHKLNVKHLDISYTRIKEAGLLELIYSCPHCTFFF